MSLNYSMHAVRLCCLYTLGNIGVYVGRVARLPPRCAPFFVSPAFTVLGLWCGLFAVPQPCEHSITLEFQFVQYRVVMAYQLFPP